jgi:hypothetical protein
MPESSHPDPVRQRLTRRQILERAAAAGALAWTAPVILQSSASATALPSTCVPYWVKLTPSGALANYCPATGSGQDCHGSAISFSFPLATAPGNPSGKPLCAEGSGGTHTACCQGGHDKVVTVTDPDPSYPDYVKVTLPSGCSFSPVHRRGPRRPLRQGRQHALRDDVCRLGPFGQRPVRERGQRGLGQEGGNVRV